MKFRVTLEPLGAAFEAEAGTPLRDLLFPYGIEFPCGGRGRCKRCRVRRLEGGSPAAGEEAAILGSSDTAGGWRLACRATLDAAVTLDVRQFETAVLADDSPFEFTPRGGFGIAVDLGTTTLVAQLVDLRTARVLGVRTALNPQAAYGADIMSRLQFALHPDGARTLRDRIRREIGAMAAALAARAGELSGGVAIVGNTAMHHLFCGLDVAPLAQAPFETPDGGGKSFCAAALGWDLPGNPEVRFLTCLGGFVGSDILAGIRATRLAGSSELAALIDLGTNGEIVVGNRVRLLCASTAAGPAFEGGRISAGMRAASGAIAEVFLENGAMRSHVLGGGAARGLCGSGLVDAIRCALDLDLVLPHGRLAGGARSFPVAPEVAVTQADVREVQLAKAAIAAGVKILLRRLGAALEDVSRVYLAGAFGNYVNRESARRIGLLEFEPGRVEPAGNTALLGAKLSLFDLEGRAGEALLSRIAHVPLGADEEFQETYVESMRFPAPLSV